MIRRHWASVRRYLRVLGADAALADDLAQDVFVLALRKGIEDRGAPTAVWLRRTARNLLLDDVGRRRTVAVDVAELVWEQVGESGEQRRRALRDCLPLLTERSQRALRMAYGERRSWAQIAVELGMQAGGVKTLLRRCRDTLRDCIERATRAEEGGR
ncbi:MAG: sigma-70 family RNA polymerase sigma factor [Planctomycetota bacterium]